ncbi:unnamed protein product [Gordionus sp. m RMFG-2023]
MKAECCHIAGDSNLSLLASSNNQFSVDVLKTLIGNEKEEKNIIMSPFNASQSLSMLLLGSKAKTFTQLAQTLHYDKILKDTSLLTPKNQETLHETIKEMNEVLTKLSKHVTLDFGNGLYPDDLFPLDSHYLEVIKGMYKAKIRNLNFMKDPSNAEKIINEDTAQATKGRIQNLLPPNSLDKYTRLVLTSTIYFKGDWKDKFDPSLTQKMAFMSDDGHAHDIPMMQGVKKANYCKIAFSEHDGVGYEVKVLRLDYVDEKLAMFFVLPPQNGLSQFIKDLTPERLNRIVTDLRLEKEIRVTIPVFKIEYETKLKDTIQALGSVDIFGNNADLSGITSASKGDIEQKLYLSQVYQKAFIEVNEEGCEAAAATGAVIALRAMLIPKEFTASRPFLYFIMDMVNSCILFIGTFVIPRSD